MRVIESERFFVRHQRLFVLYSLSFCMLISKVSGYYLPTTSETPTFVEGWSWSSDDEVFVVLINKLHNQVGKVTVDLAAVSAVKATSDVKLYQFNDKSVLHGLSANGVVGSDGKMKLNLPPWSATLCVVPHN